MPLESVPVSMLGKYVGSATIHDEGTLTIVTEVPCDLGKNLIPLMNQGFYNSLIIRPVLLSMVLPLGTRQPQIPSI